LSVVGGDLPQPTRITISADGIRMDRTDMTVSSGDVYGVVVGCRRGATRSCPIGRRVC
jgi:hypothetical protein